MDFRPHHKSHNQTCERKTHLLYPVNVQLHFYICPSDRALSWLVNGALVSDGCGSPQSKKQWEAACEDGHRKVLKSFNTELF